MKQEIMGDSFKIMKQAEREAAFHARQSKSSIMNDIVSIKISPAMFLLRKLSKTMDAIIYKEKAKQAQFEYKQRSDVYKGNRASATIDRVRDQFMEQKRNLRTSERRLRREYARTSRDSEILYNTYRKAEHIKAAGISDILSPTKKINEKGYIKEIYFSVSGVAKGMSSEQWKQARHKIVNKDNERGYAI